MRTNFSRNSIYFQKKRIQTRETKNSLERYRKRRVATLKHTSFASPLDSILFRDSTHSSHFAQPLGTSGTSIPPFTSRSTDTDVPTSAALASPPPLPFSFPLSSVSSPFLVFSFSNCSYRLRFLSSSASFPSFPRPSSFVRSFVRRFQPSTASSTSSRLVSFVHPIL